MPSERILPKVELQARRRLTRKSSILHSCRIGNGALRFITALQLRLSAWEQVVEKAVPIVRFVPQMSIT